MTPTSYLLDRLSHLLCFWWYLRLFPPRANQPGTQDPAEPHCAGPTVLQELTAQGGTEELYQHPHPSLRVQTPPHSRVPTSLLGCWTARWGAMPPQPVPTHPHMFRGKSEFIARRDSWLRARGGRDNLFRLPADVISLSRVEAGLVLFRLGN